MRDSADSCMTFIWAGWIWKSFLGFSSGPSRSRMNIKLEDFVKEYICMEQDIHIEDLQESVMQYGRMRSKIEETLEEIRSI